MRHDLAHVVLQGLGRHEAAFMGPEKAGAANGGAVQHLITDVDPMAGQAGRLHGLEGLGACAMAAKPEGCKTPAAVQPELVATR